LAEGTKAGISGCSCRHGSLLTGRRAMRAASTTALRGPVTKWCSPLLMDYAVHVAKKVVWQSPQIIRKPGFPHTLI
jgi:hypothetical protein